MRFLFWFFFVIEALLVSWLVLDDPRLSAGWIGALWLIAAVVLFQRMPQKIVPLLMVALPGVPILFYALFLVAVMSSGARWN